MSRIKNKAIIHHFFKKIFLSLNYTEQTLVKIFDSVRGVWTVHCSAWIPDGPSRLHPRHSQGTAKAWQCVSGPHQGLTPSHLAFTPPPLLSGGPSQSNNGPHPGVLYDEAPAIIRGRNSVDFPSPGRAGRALCGTTVQTPIILARRKHRRSLMRSKIKHFSSLTLALLWHLQPAG